MVWTAGARCKPPAQMPTPLFSRIKIERFVGYLGENDEMRTRKRCLLAVLCEVPRLTSLQFVPYFDPLRIMCSGGDSKNWKIGDH
jgi:hypothetical protein